MTRIGLIDCDRTKFPNLALMKLSAHHKAQGDNVEWYQPFGERYDKVYISRVFSTSPDYDLCVNADEVVRGGTGYEIKLISGREVYNKGSDLPNDVEHIYIGRGNAEWGAPTDEDVFIIKLGKRIE